MHAPRRWEIALLIVTALWGATFTIIRDTLERIPPFLFIALRFGVAGMALAAAGAFRRASRRDLRAGALLGVVLFAGYAFQFTGQQYTSPSNAGFITGLFVVFTPLIGGLYYRRAPARSTLGGVVLATVGLVLLAWKPHAGVGKGDLLVLGTAVMFAIHILALGRFAPGRSVMTLTATQVLTTSAIATVWTVAAERQAPPIEDAFVWGSILLTGVAATAVGFAVQTRAQQSSPPTRTAVILTAEPFFAGLFGYVLAGDRLGLRGYIGAASIFCGIAVAELLSPRTERV